MASNETSPSLAKGIISRATRRPAELAQVWLGEHNLDSGNSPNESENSITHDRHPAHPWGCSLRCTRRVACHLHSAGSSQPATTCPSRSCSRTRDGLFGAQALGCGHGHASTMDWFELPPH